MLFWHVLAMGGQAYVVLAAAGTLGYLTASLAGRARSAGWPSTARAPSCSAG